MAIHTFKYGRKISCGLYNPDRKFETEDFAVEGDSFEECQKEVNKAVEARIAELSSEYETACSGQVQTKP